jgi:1,4-alpha-glucan branching enzyme
MPVRFHHRPIDATKPLNLHAWDGRLAWDLPGVRNGSLWDFQIPDVPDARRLQFKFRQVDPVSHAEVWESDDYVRRVRRAGVTDVWSFGASARPLYADPTQAPAGTVVAANAVLTVHVITRSRFRGGRLYAWDPFAGGQAPSAAVPEAARDDAAGVSRFDVTIQSWMVGGFHFKLLGPGGEDGDWEPEASNRVWRPADGLSVWVKSGQVSVRRAPLALTNVPMDVLYPAAAAPPGFILRDPVEQLEQALAPVGPPVPADPGGLFAVATYRVPIYPGAAYEVRAADADEPGGRLDRPFPADSARPTATSRLVLGAPGWVANFPPVGRTVTVAVTPRAASAFAGGVIVRVGVGSAAAHDAVPAALQAGGDWNAAVAAVPGVRHWVQLVPAGGLPEPKPYDWLDVRRYFTPPAAGGAATVYTTEGVYGTSAAGRTTFAEPPAGRAALMAAAFGQATVAAGAFGPGELPHGPTQVVGTTYFVVHAPHAVTAELVLVEEAAAGGPARAAPVAMALTPDGLYWWCRVPSARAPHGARYRFALNGTDEVMDPAARWVADPGDFNTAPGQSPADPSTAWARVADPAVVAAALGPGGWDTMGWEALLLYEVHPKRFTNLSPGPLAPLDLLADELKAANRLGQPGYLRQLPVTALALLPVHEFRSTDSWGYNPAFYFAVDSGYGGPEALARLVRAAHAAGRGVLLDLVYNHCNDSPLTRIARDVYRNGDAWGDKINNAHPMVVEFLRQATVYLWRTFGLDGFRFDSTKTIIDNMGWGSLGAIRAAVRAAAAAAGKRWPYFVGENDPKYWDMTTPAWGVIDGQWAMDELRAVGDAAYDPWNDGADHAGEVRAKLEVPHAWGRSFAEATRFGESHDSVSGQDAWNKRIAARPPYRQGFQMAKAVGALALLANGVPMVFMGQEVGETRYFSFDNAGPVTNPQDHDLPPGSATDQTRVLAWFRSLMGLRNDPAKGLRGNENGQSVRTGHRTVALSVAGGRLFVVVTFGTADVRQDSGWLGLPGGATYKEIFNSSWPAFQVEFEAERPNGGHDAWIRSGQSLNLPYIGAVVLERR